MYVYLCFIHRESKFFATPKKQFSPIRDNVALLRIHEPERRGLILLSHLCYLSKAGDF